MGIFRRSRRQPAEEKSAPIAGETDAPVDRSGQHLRERLREIVSGAGAPEEAFEPVLRAILEASSAQVGAVCVYDARHRGLRLVAEVGLSDEGCRRLRNVRRADPTSWDMPLQGLLNRRAYLIESAARNRYVPRLVEASAGVRTVACIPLYLGLMPVGSLILATLAPRALGERDIHALERPVGELARLIEQARRHASGLGSEDVPPLPLVDTVPERNRLQHEAEMHLAEQARLTAELAALGAERDRLREALEAAANEQARLESEVARVRDEGKAAAALVTSEVEAARAAAHTESGRYVARIAELVAETERLQSRLVAAETVETRMRERERDYERLATELRAAAGCEQRLRGELEAMTRSVEDGGREEVRVALEAARMAEAAAAAAAVEAEAARTALGATQSIVEALEEEASQARTEIEHAQAAMRAAQAEQGRLELQLGEMRTRDLAATARLAELARETEMLREERTRQTAEGREQQAETVTLVARLEALTAERDRLRESLAEFATERTAAAPAPAAAPPPPREPVRLVTLSAPRRARARSHEAGRQLVAVLDVDPAWEQVAIDGHQVTVLPPNDEAAAELAESTPARIIANLAAPGTLGTLAALRASGSTARVWGCLADASRGRVLPLGMIEPADRPLDPDGILSALGPYAVRGTRVVTAGADVDALMSLRQALARQGMSVSMVWDAKQALDVFRVVRPEVVVIDLNLPKRDGYRIAAHCAEIDPIPHAIFIPGVDDAAAAFAAACAASARAVRGIAPKQMVSDVIAGNEAPPVERKQKLRAIGK